MEQNEKTSPPRIQNCNAGLNLTFSRANPPTPLSMSEIVSHINLASGGNLRKITTDKKCQLVLTEDGKVIRHIRSSVALFGYLGSISKYPPFIIRKPGYCTKREIYWGVIFAAPEFTQ